MAQDAAWSELDPVAEALVERARERRVSAPVGRERLVAWVSGGGFALAAGLLASLASTSRTEPLASAAVLVGLYALLSRIEFEVANGFALPSELALVPMFAILPAKSIPLAVALGLVAGHAPDYVRGRLHPRRIARLVGNGWFAFGPAAVLLAFHEPAARFGTLPVYGAAVAAQLGADLVSSTAREYVAVGVSPRALLRPLAWVFAVDLLLFPVGFLTAIPTGSQPLAPLLVVPLAALLVVFSRERQAHLNGALELSHAYRGTAFLLGDVVEADDAYTGSHSKDVVELVLGVCDRLGLDPRERRRAEFTALLHDIGKIQIPSSIINKPGPLDEAERELMKQHTIIGETLLERVGGLLGEVGTLVRSCHEHYDGSGYPDGLAGEEIPLVARIVCCCDAYNAMTTDRSYRRAMRVDEALAEVGRCAGTQFDPDVAAALAATVLEPAA